MASKVNQHSDPSLQGCVESRPSIVGMSCCADESLKVYDAWAHNYEQDIRSWGYKMPERVAELVKHQVTSTDLIILDAGSGDGLSGIALRNAGFPAGATRIIGADLSPEMLNIAKQRNCYDETKEIDLNKTLPFETNAFDVITCVGTITYVDPSAGTFREFIRITKPGGLICYTNRTDKLEDFVEEELKLEKERLWTPLHKIGPMPYLPLNPDYGGIIEAVMYMFRVTKD